MGIEESDKGKWYKRVAEDYWNKAKWAGGKAKDLYERDKEWSKKKGIAGLTTTPYLWNMLDAAGFVGTDAPAFDVDKAGTGKKDSIFGVKVPEAWKSYDTQKQFADYGVEMTPKTHPKLDKAQRAMNLISDTAKWPLNAIQSGLEFLPDIPHITGAGLKEIGASLDKTQTPKGTGAWWTQMQDMIGTNPIAKALSFGSVVPTNMEGDYSKFWDSAYPPITDEGYFDTDLKNWGLYQNYKSGSGWDTADDRRIDNRVEATMKNKPIPPGEALQSFYKYARENMDKVVGQDGITGADLVASPDAVDHYFKQYFQGVKEEGRNNLRNEYEFQKTGQKFADWMSKEYRNESIKKYGMYPVFEEGAIFKDGTTKTQLEMLSDNISPFETAPAMVNTANKDYIDAVKKGKEDIGEPLEWDYGAYDKSPGVGIPEDHKKWFEWMEYGTKEAEKVFESNQAEGLELASLFVMRAPLALRGPIQNWLQTSKVGRVLRETMPGLFQHGSRANFGIHKFATKTAGGGRNWWYTALNVPAKTIDFIRPKGGQMLGAIALGEAGANWDRN
jgi:hypothetical protein